MITINIFLYTLLTLVWIALASFIVLRIPKCKTLNKSLQMFVIVFLVLQIFIQGHQLYDTLVKENVIQVSNKQQSNNIISDKNTLNSLSNLLLSSQWFNLLSLLLTVVLYYIIFNAISRCGEKQLDKRLIWGFLISTIVQYLFMAILKSKTENKLLLSAMAK